MAQFKRFSGSESENYNSSYVGREGELTWDPNNGLRIHDGNESGGNPIGITSYQNLNDLPTNLASIQTSSSTNNRQFLRYNSSTSEVEYANDFKVVPFADIDYPDGVVGDKVGDVAFDDSGIYYCGSEPNFIGDVTITSSSGYSNQAWITLTSIPASGPVQVGQRLTDGTNTSTVEEIVEAWPGYTGSREIIRLAAATSTWHDGTPGTLSVISSGEGVSSGNWVKFSNSYNDLTNKPTLFSGDYDDLTDKPTLFSGDYDDLTGKPTIRITVATGSGPGGNNQADSLALAGLNPVTDIPSTWGGDLILQGGVGGANGDLYGEVRIKSGQIGANYEWHFTTDKKIKLPAGGDIVDSTGATVFVSVATLKQIVAASTDFADFQTRIANM
jgi:hypothetical protein